MRCSSYSPRLSAVGYREGTNVAAIWSGRSDSKSGLISHVIDRI